ncbi:MAG TPA: pilus assembly protein N-terminal domain-containing protein, partial [Candidatus Baltobacteraceae bacterium]|jgi:pilus assembly protein CpaC|nr:pilus assembly protein N-terminal domain-containing protein [Candidatus Baltobacteraceae bacterium]
LTLQTGHSLVVRVHDLRRVAVGNADCVGVVAVGTEQLVVNGKLPCRTSVFVWGGDGSRDSYEVLVTSEQLDKMSQMLRAAISEPDVEVVSFGSGIILRGTVPDMASYVELQDVLSHFDDYAHENKYSIVNAVRIAHSLRSIGADFANVSGVSDLQIEPDGKGNVIVSGKVPDELTSTRVIQRARTLAGPFLAAKGDVVDRLEVANESEVDVKVYVLEVDRTGLSQLGVNLQAGNPDPNNPKQITLGPPFFPILEDGSAGLPGKAFNAGAFERTTLLAPTIDLLIQKGHARVLSSPDLVALPGTDATFLVGGSIPYVYSTGIGQVSVVFKDYGVQLNVTPQILPSGSIRTKITPDISDLDFQNAVQIGGFFIPALKESKISTDLVTKPGQSILMGGLLRRIEQKNIVKVPFLSNIPILGKLFQDVRYQTGQTDVVFVMTPQIVNQ